MEWDELRCARPHLGERGGISIGNSEKRPVVAVDAAGDVEKETFQRAIADAEPLEAPLPITDDQQDIGKKFAIPPWKTAFVNAGTEEKRHLGAVGTPHPTGQGKVLVPGVV